MSDRASSAAPATGRRSVAARFSAAAGTYDGPAEIQRAVARRLVEWLCSDGSAAEPDRLLELGCGTGIFTRALAERYPAATIVATDLSEDMVRAAQRNVGVSGRIRWEVADAREFSTRDRFPLVVSSCALHWASPFSDTARNVAALLAPGGRLVAALMVDGTLSELHAARLAVAPGVPPRSRLPTDTEVREGVLAAGLSVDRMECSTLTARHQSAGQFLRAIHEQGLTGGPVSAGHRPLTRRELSAVAEWYDARCRVEAGGVRATYRVCYVRAQAEVQR
jgi:malonyl-CoA O-methyltransferase